MKTYIVEDHIKEKIMSFRRKLLQLETIVHEQANLSMELEARLKNLYTFMREYTFINVKGSIWDYFVFKNPEAKQWFDEQGNPTVDLRDLLYGRQQSQRG